MMDGSDHCHVMLELLLRNIDVEMAKHAMVDRIGSRSTRKQDWQAQPAHVKAQEWLNPRSDNFWGSSIGTFLVSADSFSSTSISLALHVREWLLTYWRSSMYGSDLIIQPVWIDCMMVLGSRRGMETANRFCASTLCSERLELSIAFFIVMCAWRKHWYVQRSMI